jgi:hypothetical protein
VGMVSALVVSLLAVLFAAGQSQTQPPEPIRLRPGSAVTIAPGQTTTVLCEAGLSRCVCTYNRRPGEFSYELNWIAPTLPPRHNHAGALLGQARLSRRDGARAGVSALIRPAPA